jgi:hypothetical protein
VLETFDFVKQLKDLGYEFPDIIQKKPWEAGPNLRKALLELLDGFKERHPGFENGDYKLYEEVEHNIAKSESFREKMESVRGNSDDNNQESKYELDL